MADDLKAAALAVGLDTLAAERAIELVSLVERQTAELMEAAARLASVPTVARLVSERVSARKDWSMAGVIAEMEAMQYPPETVAKVQSIILRRPQAANKAEAARHFGVVVDVVEQYCKTSRTEPQASKPLAEDIKTAIDALLRARKERPAGIGMLQRALGDVKAKINSK